MTGLCGLFFSPASVKGCWGSLWYRRFSDFFQTYILSFFRCRAIIFNQKLKVLCETFFNRNWKNYLYHNLTLRPRLLLSCFYCFRLSSFSCYSMLCPARKAAAADKGSARVKGQVGSGIFGMFRYLDGLARRESRRAWPLVARVPVRNTWLNSSVVEQEDRSTHRPAAAACWPANGHQDPWPRRPRKQCT